MGDCQNYGPFLGPIYNTGPNTGPNLGDPKRDHNFDNLPYVNDGYLAGLQSLVNPQINREWHKLANVYEFVKERDGSQSPEA